MINALDQGISDERELYNENLLVILEDFVVHFYENQMSLTDKFSLGNCGELTNKALDYFVTHDLDNIRAERYKIDNSDHVFLVINRPISSDPNDPTTWGEYTFICDPLLNKVYPAKKYLTELKDYTSTRKEDVKTNHFLDFNPKKQKLMNDNYFNSDYLRPTRNTKNMKLTFLEKMNDLKRTLNSYKFKLLWINISNNQCLRVSDI